MEKADTIIKNENNENCVDRSEDQITEKPESKETTAGSGDPYATGTLQSALLETAKESPDPVLKSLDLTGIADLIKCGGCSNVIVMCGAGISTSAGIPDFRSPGSGLYANLAEYNLPYPEAIFELGYFMQQPKPFFVLSKQLYSHELRPTVSHYLIRLLADKGILLRVFTQNVDTLEHVAGVPEKKIIEAHGSFRFGHCMNRSCAKEFSQEWVKEKVMADEVPRCDLCETVVKPDIIFFGEALPNRFFDAIKDFAKCDLLIVMGTSLQVQPFASLIGRVGGSVPRLLINRERAGGDDLLSLLMGEGSSGFNFDGENNQRDVFCEGDCDAGCAKLANLCEWEKEFGDLIERERKKLDGKQDLCCEDVKVKEVGASNL